MRSIKPYMKYLFVLLSVVSFYGLAGMNDVQLAKHESTAPQAPQAMSVFNDARISGALKHLDHRIDIHENDLEARLFKALIYFKVGSLEQAMYELDELLAREPKFHLAHLIKGDLILASLDNVSDIGINPMLAGLDKKQQEQLHRLRWEAEARLQTYMHTLDESRVPAQLIRLGKNIKTAIVVDKSLHRTYVFENVGSDQPPRLLRDFYSSTGKLEGNKRVEGDLKTPEGVYFVTTQLMDKDLEDKYGTGAFPLNYPNEYDQHLGKTGYGIWLHGTDKTFYSRPPLDSEGCVALTNIDLDAVKAYITPGLTPVVITQQIEWIDSAAWLAQHQAMMQNLESWRSAWEQADFNKYIGFYANEFWSGRYNYKSWRTRKRLVFSGKTNQKIILSNISIFKYPDNATDKKDMMVVNFHQDYRSNNFNTEVDKRLYFINQGDALKIYYEGSQ